MKWWQRELRDLQDWRVIFTIAVLLYFPVMMVMPTPPWSRAMRTYPVNHGTVISPVFREELEKVVVTGDVMLDPRIDFIHDHWCGLSRAERIPTSVTIRWRLRGETMWREQTVKYPNVEKGDDGFVEWHLEDDGQWRLYHKPHRYGAKY